MNTFLGTKPLSLELRTLMEVSGLQVPSLLVASWGVVAASRERAECAGTGDRRTGFRDNGDASGRESKPEEEGGGEVESARSTGAGERLGEPRTGEGDFASVAEASGRGAGPWEPPSGHDDGREADAASRGAGRRGPLARGTAPKAAGR